MHNALKFDLLRKELHGVFMTLGLVAILTAVLFGLVWGIDLAHGSVVFLIPVVIAATRLKWQLEMARQREIDLRDLYAFSRRLAVAFDVSDIHAAIEDHLASIM